MHEYYSYTDYNYHYLPDMKEQYQIKNKVIIIHIDEGNSSYLFLCVREILAGASGTLDCLQATR